MVEAIHKFWRLCSNRLRGDESRYGRLLSNLVLLTAFLDRLTDQTKDLLLQAAPYADESHHSSLFLEELARLAQVSPADVGEVFLALLTRALPTYDPKDVREIVAALYRSGSRDTANRIADLYARKQFDLLRDLYDQNNRTQ